MANEHNDVPVGFSLEEEERILQKRYRKARREGRGKKRAGDKVRLLNINSMMDLMTIILVFLLMTSQQQTVQPEMSDELFMPWSTSTLEVEDTITITVTNAAVLVNNRRVVDVRDGDISEANRISSTSPIIPELQTAIEDVLHAEDRWDVVRDTPGRRIATVIADNRTTYQVLTYIMMTASAAGVQNFKFAVLQRERGTLWQAS